MKKNRLFYLFFLYLCLALTVNSYSVADVLYDDVFDLSLAELMQVKITGSTLTEKDLNTVPASVTVFTKQEINLLGLDNLTELMNLVPGFQSYRNGITASISPHSVRARRIAGSGSEVLMLIDGQRIDTPNTSGSTHAIPKYPLTNIERVEFIRGPGSAVYGSNAMLGVINIISQSQVSAINITLGSFHYQKASIQLAQQWHTLQIDLFAQYQRQQGQDYIVNDSFTNALIHTDDPNEQGDIKLKLAWQDTQLNILHSFFHDKNFYIASLLANEINQHGASFTSTALKHHFNLYSAKSYLWLSYHQSKSNITGQPAPAGSFIDISQPPSNDPFIASIDEPYSKEYRLQWHNDILVNKVNSLQLGLEYRHINVDNFIVKNNFDLTDIVQGNFPIRYYGELKETSLVQSASQRDIYGVYSQYQGKFFSNTELTIGLRYDYFSTIGSHLSPRIAVTQQINANQTVKLIYSQAFRAPSEAELNLQNNLQFAGSPNLQAETVQTWELIWQGQWQHFNASLGYFENHFDNAIVRVANEEGTLAYLNLEQNPVKGFEVESSFQINQYWRIKANYSHINEKLDLSFREAAQLGSFIINYQEKNWNLNISATWRGKSDMATLGSDLNKVTLPSYWQVFAKVIYNISPSWQTYLQAKNLLDNNYHTPAETANLPQGVPNRGQELSLSFNYTF